MGVIANRRRPARAAARREADPRVRRSRAAVIAAARALFLEHGYAGTTMEEIAAAAGLTKRTLYNNYADKDALFSEIVAEVMAYAEAFAAGLREEFAAGVTGANLEAWLDDVGRRLALGIMRPDVIALRRLIIAEARSLPSLGARYFDRVPGQVLEAMASGFAQMHRRTLLRVPDGELAAAQFAYLVVGEPLDRAMLTGTLPSQQHVVAFARDGVETFLARYRLSGRRRR